MEGYFVRTLGMHRVYNSAFMIMLRDEDNAKYRSVIKNTLEFDPDIMKRYVNFMSNPDERTAIDQFGKGDKCFGVAVMMSTLPGLPMFGHGQIEGFTEKYGMEYRWPRYEEWPDHSLVERHDREIAPLLKRRWLFAESSNFLLYDFFTANGSVDENVFAYSNRNGSERALVVYNNRYGSTHGTIDFSAAFADKGSGQLRQRRLAEGIGLSGDRGAVVAWRDSLTGLEYLRRAEDLYDRGLTFDLHAYQCHVYLDLRELRPTAEHPWDRLSDWLNGRGVPNLEDELVNLELRPVHDALRQLLHPDVVRHFADLAEHPGSGIAEAAKKQERQQSNYLKDVSSLGEVFLAEAKAGYATRREQEGQPVLSEQQARSESETQTFSQRLRAAMRLPQIEALFSPPWTAAARRMLPSPSPQVPATEMWGPVLGWCALQFLAESIDAENPERASLDLFDRLRLRAPFAHAFAALGFEGEEAWRVAARIKVLLLVCAGPGEQPKPAPPTAIQAPTKRAIESHATDGKASQPPAPKTPQPCDEKLSFAPNLWRDPDVRWLTGAHEAEGHTYFIHERYEELLWWLLMPSLLRLAGETAPVSAKVKELSSSIGAALKSAKSAGYRVDVLLGEPDSVRKAGTDGAGISAEELSEAIDQGATPTEI
jgi:hypothetical protein